MWIGWIFVYLNSSLHEQGTWGMRTQEDTEEIWSRPEPKWYCVSPSRQKVPSYRMPILRVNGSCLGLLSNLPQVNLSRKVCYYLKDIDLSLHPACSTGCLSCSVIMNVCLINGFVWGRIWHETYFHYDQQEKLWGNSSFAPISSSSMAVITHWKKWKAVRDQTGEGGAQYQVCAKRWWCMWFKSCLQKTNSLGRKANIF